MGASVMCQLPPDWGTPTPWPAKWVPVVPTTKSRCCPPETCPPTSYGELPGPVAWKTTKRWKMVQVKLATTSFMPLNSKHGLNQCSPPLLIMGRARKSKTILLSITDLNWYCVTENSKHSCQFCPNFSPTTSSKTCPRELNRAALHIRRSGTVKERAREP